MKYDGVQISRATDLEDEAEDNVAVAASLITSTTLHTSSERSGRHLRLISVQLRARCANCWAYTSGHSPAEASTIEFRSPLSSASSRPSLCQQEAFLSKGVRPQSRKNKHQSEVSALQWRDILGSCTWEFLVDAWCDTG
jgi:hypothetical protein